MFQNRDTIAAQATAAGEGGVAIVRVSGADCLRIISRVFRAKNGKPLENRVLTYGYVMEDGGVVDEAMAVLMRAPHSYTREDVAEIHCHGSQTLVGKILRLLMAAGARMAEPGEFTYRAFLNGRIDLAQAEGVMRMIRAGSERAMRSAVRQMEGGVSAFVRTAREEITSLLAAMAAAIDFPDEVEETQTAREVTAACKAIAAKLAAACDARAGRIEDEGLRVVLCGRPNAGKSSLLNRLLGRERAIVTANAGTTRDTVEEKAVVGGVLLRLTPQGIKPPPAPPQPLDEGSFSLPGGYFVEFRRVKYEEFLKNQPIFKKDLNCCADCAKIQGNVMLRTRQPGDSFRPAGRHVRKTLKKYYNELGVPLDERALLPLLASGSEVLWLWGSGFAEGCAPDAYTHEVLTVRTEKTGEA